jgi:hypothetical protein
MTPFFFIEADSELDIGHNEKARYRITTCSDMTAFVAEMGFFYKAITGEKIQEAKQEELGFR